MFFQPGIDAVTLDHANHWHIPVPERVGFDEALADAVIDLIIVPAHGNATGDDGAH